MLTSPEEKLLKRLEKEEVAFRESEVWRMLGTSPEGLKSIVLQVKDKFSNNHQLNQDFEEYKTNFEREYDTRKQGQTLDPRILCAIRV
ncbi:MAG: hypothetical protein A3G32_05030 [Deltaproteobacteria bacterium RIFCSPLOWO2_12_FULL_40_28]|nr:MAG: hypothetical protein A3C45_09140 [Deltaproteobacteria bacterium RIFCSPHIGHO2_02_FULL_40_28]OGQ19728.1 MAG: hypothetical protein A3E27_08335 [Deltaproteobacteria bacterium RIFCSPHIGHO2_12_FULL_40_32]OGQ41005.1 MAG: hypothetical protein A3I69_03750 [Deltaproteobacteria bacterium RIFCSPLOWO2_02_FULL_40_36]OGQ54121.1 MAG: hypothetical protein A3G32_05030 [Deltaproteobacteria bacterium RIFCSPLOWO2_12_FULL_40_28]